MSLVKFDNELNIKVEGTEYKLNLIGSTLTSWKVNGREIIFNSENSILDGKNEYFGGIPLVFPQFALAKEPNPAHKLPIHGFARLLKFEYLEVLNQICEKEVIVNLGINSTQFEFQNPELSGLWPYKFNLISTYTFTKDKLSIKVEIDNFDNEELWITPLFHNYFNVMSIHKTKLTGLGGIEYWDKNDKNQVTPKCNEVNEVRISQPIDNIYINSILTPDNKLTLIEEDYKLELSAINLKDCVVWNPWSGGSDFGLNERDFEKFLCVELGQVIDPYKLQPENSWSYEQSIKFIQN